MTDKRNIGLMEAKLGIDERTHASEFFADYEQRERLNEAFDVALEKAGLTAQCKDLGPIDMITVQQGFAALLKNGQTEFSSLEDLGLGKGL